MYEAYVKLKEKLPDDENVYRRLNRALDIVQGFGYELKQHSEDSELWVVNRASTSLFDNNEAQYFIDDTSCTCPDFKKARAGLCKHRLAVKLIEMSCGE